MTFGAYVGGAKVAIVGPAAPVGDQQAAVEAHDLVYRVAGHMMVDLYTDRADILFFNGETGRCVLEDDNVQLRGRCERATWWVFKGRGWRPQGLYRSAMRPNKVENPNAVTNMIWDLLAFDPRRITVFGADLYAGGPGTAYAPESAAMPTASGVERTPERIARGVMAHKPLDQKRLHRRMVETGIVTGDDRYLAAVTMPDEDYAAIIAEWAAAAPEPEQAA